jgi:hypothetical protein
MRMRERLPLLLCWLLCFSGAIISSSAAWVGWLGAQSPSIETIHRVLPVASALGIRESQYWISLAELEPEKEEQHLRRVIQSDPRCLPALLRLSLLAEFRSDRREARRLQDEALAHHRSYRTYMAALAQAARWKEPARTQWLGKQALRYCPRDRDGVFAQLGSLEIAESVLGSEALELREDYLRYLIGQMRVDDALDYQTRLPRLASIDQRRLELCELLFWRERREQASKLFTQMHPEFGSDGTYNGRLRSKPSSLAFDWRITNDAKAQWNWRPGEIEIKLAEHDEPLELMSIYANVGDTRLGRVAPNWIGETTGLYWKLDAQGTGWKRVALVAPPGGPRNFRIHEVRLE